MTLGAVQLLVTTSAPSKFQAPCWHKLLTYLSPAGSVLLQGDATELDPAALIEPTVHSFEIHWLADGVAHLVVTVSLPIWPIAPETHACETKNPVEGSEQDFIMVLPPTRA